MVLAVVMLSVPILAQGMKPCGAVDVLGRGGGIFQSEASAFQFPEFADTNFDRLTVGNDRALAFGGIWRRPSLATATNNLMIEKNQDSGECVCGERIIDNVSPSHMSRIDCMDCCIKVNIIIASTCFYDKLYSIRKL